MCFLAAVTSFWSFVYPLLEEQGSDEERTASLMTLVGLTALISRVFLVVSKRMCKLHPLYYLTSVSLIYSFSAMVLPWCSGRLWQLVVVCGTLGFGYGQVWVSYVLLVVRKPQVESNRKNVK